MKKTLLLCLSCGLLSVTAHARAINVPDSVFLSHLLTVADLDRDGSISEAEAAQLTELRIDDGRGITDFSGLEYFTGLQELWLEGADATSISLSGQMQLQELLLKNMPLVQLDLLSCPLLHKLNLNTLTIESLTLPMISLLDTVLLSVTNLSELDLAAAHNLNDLDVRGCAYLQSITINPDTHASMAYLSVNDDCSELDWICIPEGLEIDVLHLNRTELLVVCDEDYVFLPDPAFRQYMVARVDADRDGNISYPEAAAYEELRIDDCRGMNSFEGLQHFTGLSSIWLTNAQVATIPLEGKPVLESLRFDDSPVTNLAIELCPQLLSLTLIRTDLPELDLSICPSLTHIYLYGGGMDHIEFGSSSNLQNIGLRFFVYPEFDLRSITQLEEITIRNSTIDRIDLRGLARFSSIACHESPGLTVCVDEIPPRITVYTDAEDLFSLCDEVADAMETPGEFALLGAWPNPFNPTTQIRFSLAQADETNLQLFNLQGQLLRTLVQGLLPAGEHNLTLDAGDLSSGVYLLVLRSDNQQAVKRVAILK